MTRITPTILPETRSEKDRHGISISGMRLAIPPLARYLSTCFYAERTRWALWIPVFMGAGVALYFYLPQEPEIWLGPALFGIALLAVIASRWRSVFLIPAYGAFFLALGFGAAQLRTLLVEAPVLAKKLGPVTIEGRIARTEILTKGRRLWLDRLTIDRLDKDKTPRRVRIKLFAGEQLFQPGDLIRVRAILHPPSGPAMPGSFDFARRAFFQGLGGVGFAISRPSIVRHGEKEGVSIWLASLRHRLTKLILETVPGPAGAIAAALMTGERAAIPEETLAAMRESGLAHLLAISGLHMGLIGGLLFFVVRFGLASIERLALRYPIKKMAAVAALLGSLAYLFISGATLPTQRAFLMLSLIMLAVMIDRSAISMNMIAWAAGVILLVAPESLMSVSFQMSFAAVTALVATYELHYAGKLNHTGGQSKLARSMFYIAAVLLTTLVAGAATAPFALYHFNQVALLGVLANLFAVPLTALWVMPCAIAAFLLMPLGLSELALVPMGWGIEAIVRVAETVQALPGSAMPVVAMPEWGFALMALGGLWLCLWRRSWRLFGLFPIVISIAAISLTKTPDILVSDPGKLIAVKGLDERLVFQRHARGFVADTWRRRNGQLPLGKIPMAERPARLSNQRCDLLGCVLRIRGQTVALVKEIAALSEDCAVATIVISVVPVRKRHCQEPEIVIGRYDLWRKGAHALWLLPEGIKLETVAGTNSRRPWSIYPRQYR